MSNHQTRESLNKRRTPEELAAFKAANNAAADRDRKNMPLWPERTTTKKFTVTWTTFEGQFGWITVHAVRTPEAAAEAFFAARNRGQVPTDAQIELIKRGGQEI